MKRAFLKRRPEAYWKQERKECGAYVMQAVLMLFGKCGGCKPKDHLSFISNMFLGYTSPWRIRKVLSQYGLFTEFRRAKKLRSGKLDLLKMHIERQEPVILLIGNSFSSKRKYLHFRRWFVLHWVLLMGFDDDEQKVYLYDPNVRPEKHEKNIPIGNVSLSYRLFMRQWRGVFLTSIINYSYMPVSRIKRLL